MQNFYIDSKYGTVEQLSENTIKEAFHKMIEAGYNAWDSYEFDSLTADNYTLEDYPLFGSDNTEDTYVHVDVEGFGDGAIEITINELDDFLAAQKAGETYIPKKDTNVEKLRPTSPKHQVRVVYKKITESIFDLRDDFEQGKLYWYYQDEDQWVEINSEYDLMTYGAEDNLYRRVEKVVDWRDEVKTFINNTEEFEGFNLHLLLDDQQSELFLRMCRIVLRAIGELPQEED